MAKQQLHYAQVFRPPVDEGCLRAPHRVRAVRGVVKPNLPHPAVDDPGVPAPDDLPNAAARGGTDAGRYSNLRLR